MYDFKQYHDFLVKPLPETVYDIYAEDEDIEEFFISFFSELNQFPCMLPMNGMILILMV